MICCVRRCSHTRVLEAVLTRAENLKRFYNNSMLDADKQNAMNLFVRPRLTLGLCLIMELTSRQLGISPSTALQPPPRPHYRQWFTPSHLETPKIDELAPLGDVYTEYYEPCRYTELDRMYAMYVKGCSLVETPLSRADR